MLSFPLIARELRVQSRKRATYDVRLAAGLAAVALLAFFVWNFPQHSANGRYILAVIHGSLAIMLFVLAPIGAADAISREKREGTLGLLLLTELTPTQIVLGKFASHFLRLFYFAIMMLPIIIIPVFLGGVDLQDFLLSFVILLTIAAAGLSGALIASALVANFGAALAWAMIFAAVFTLAAGSSIVNALLALVPSPRLFGIPMSFRIFALGPMLLMFPVQAREVAGVLTPFRWIVAYAEIGLLLFSALLLRFSVTFCAGKIAQHSERAVETKRQAAFRQKLLTPVVWRTGLRRSMRRKLDRNPLIWLEYRTPWARAARWSMILLVAGAEARLIVALPFQNEVLSAHFYMLLIFLAFLTFKSSSSFQQEKESGAFELLLVTPLTETKLFVARLRAVASYYGPIALILTIIGFIALTWAQPSPFYDENRLSSAVCFTSLCGSIVSAPISGLYFALRCRTFLPALFWTAGVAILAPICVWSALNGMLWMAVSRGQPAFAVALETSLRAHWWPALLAVILYHAIVAAICGTTTIHLLRARQFCSIP